MANIEYKIIGDSSSFKRSMKESVEATNSLDKAVGGLKEKILEIGGIYLGFEFLKDSLSTFDSVQKANAQLEASMKSTGGVVGLTTEEIYKQGEALEQLSASNIETITGMQSVLLTFTAIRGEVFEQASTAIADMSAKMGQSLQQTAVQVGKALQDPINGITALKRVGVNFSDAQKLVIKSLVETGKAAEAQQLILKELNTEFGGSAKAELDASPILQATKAFEQLKDAVGEGLMSAFVAIEPQILAFVDLLKEGVKWTKENWGLVKHLGEILIVAGTAYTLLSIATKLNTWYIGMSTAAIITNTLVTEGWTGAMVALNLAIEANPIGLAIAGITSLALAITFLIKDYKSLQELSENGVQKNINEGIDDETKLMDKLSESYEKLGYNKLGAQKMALRSEASSLVDDISKLKQEMDDAYLLGDVAESQTRIFNLRMGSLTGRLKSINTLQASTGIKGNKPKTEEPVAPTKKETARENITINITKLVESLSVHTATLKEGTAEIKDIIASALQEVVYSTKYAGH